MTFEYAGFGLRKPTPRDVEGFIKICSDAEVMKYYGTGSGASIRTMEDAEKEIEWCNRQFMENAGRWVIAERSKDRYIGDIGFHNFIKPHNRVEIGYKLGREFWGKGIITNFIRLLIDYGFTEHEYNRIEALVDTRNEGSKKVLLHNGFRQEGTMREYEYEHGHFVDLEMYSLLRKDYFKQF
jgi:ribosomal-protein-alanine N-acetyltransferase